MKHARKVPYAPDLPGTILFTSQYMTLCIFMNINIKDLFIGFYQLVQLQYLRTGSGNVRNVSAGARTPASFAAACN